MFAFDIAFAVGGKYVDRDNILQQQKQLINYFLDSFRFPIEQNKIRLSLLAYGKDVKVVKNLNQNFALPYVRRYLDEMVIGGDDIKIEQALRGASSSIFTKGRNGVQNILVIFADDSSDSNLNAIRQARQQLSNQDVQVVLVSAGNLLKMSTAAAIATDGDSIIAGLTSKTFMQSYQKLMNILTEGNKIFLLILIFKYFFPCAKPAIFANFEAVLFYN